MALMKHKACPLRSVFWAMKGSLAAIVKRPATFTQARGRSVTVTGLAGAPKAGLDKAPELAADC